MDLCFCFFWIGFVCGCCLLLRLFSHLSLAIRSKKRNLSWADNMNLVQHLLERLRSVISLKGWDYCVIWKLSDDQRFLEWVDCCCAGSDPIIQNGEGDGLVFPVSSVSPCRDTLVHHPKTKPCHLLAELPLSMPLDSGIYAQTLMSNQATWLNMDSNSPLQEETDGTRVLIPVPIGLVELFVAKHVPAENREITNYIAAQCNIFMEQDAAVHCSTASTTMESAMMSEINTPPLLIHSGASDSPSLPYDVYVDRIRLSEAARSKHDTNNSFFEGLNDHFEDQTIMMMMESNNNNSKEQLQQQDKGDSVKMETGRSESISDCSEEDDDEDAKHRRRTGKGPQSKNLVAERKRRKKLNDKLYALRALVPKISKLDRASILGDAIEFVKELQKQVKDLQNELEEQSGDNHDEQGVKSAFNTTNEFLLLDQNGMATINHLGLKREDDSSKACKNMGSINTSFGEPGRPPNHDSNIYDKRQMEPQVEVVPLLDGNEFFVKVFSEFKTGGFVRLMESLDFLGLEVTNVNVNRFISLVSYVFKVEKRGSEMVQADHVRDSLLEITRNPTAGREWSDKQLSSENGGGNYHVDLDHHRQHHHISSRHQFHQHQQ